MSAATGFWNGVNLGEQGRARRDVKERDEREAKLQTLINSGLPPAQVQQGIRDIYGQDAPALQRHVENLFRRVAGKQPQQAQAPGRAADLASLESKAPVPLTKEQQQTASEKAELQLREGLTPQQRDLMGYGAPAPRQQNIDNLIAAAVSDAQSRGVDPSDDPKVQQLLKVKATEKPGKPVLPQLKQIQGQDVLWDPTTQKVVKVFGPHGSVRVTHHQAIQTDADGTPHIVDLTSVSSPGGGSVQVDASESDEGKGGSPAPTKQTAPHKAGGTPKAAGDRTLPFQKSTPSLTKATNDLTEATKLSSIADQVAQNPNDAINQKRLAVALERASAGRFTVQALDYIIKAGWGNTIEQWANNPTTGALPADVMRQLVDGAHQNKKAAQDAVDALKRKPGAPAPTGAPDAPPPGAKVRDYTQIGR